MSITINGSGSITGVSSVESIPASDVDFTPSGNISATTVQDALADIAGNSGASKIGYTPSGTGAVATTVERVLDEYVSVFRFMTPAQIADVKAFTFALDVYTAIVAADTVASAAGKNLFFPAGGYNVGSRSSAITPTTTWCGESHWYNHFSVGFPSFQPPNRGTVIDAGSANLATLSGNLTAIEILNITFKGSGTGSHINVASGTRMLRVHGCSMYGKEHAVKVSGSVAYILRFERVFTAMQTSHAMFFDWGSGSFNDIGVSDCWVFRPAGNGIYSTGTSGGCTEFNIVDNNVTDGSGDNTAIAVAGVQGSRVIGNDVEGWGAIYTDPENLTGKTGYNTNARAIQVSGGTIVVEGNVTYGGGNNFSPLRILSATKVRVGPNRLLKDISTQAYAISVDTVSSEVTIDPQQYDYSSATTIASGAANVLNNATGSPVSNAAHTFNGSLTLNGATSLNYPFILPASVPQVASASTITIPDSPVVEITGTTSVTFIAGMSRRIVTLLFTGTLTMVDSPPGVGNLRLNGDFVSSATSTLTLMATGTGGSWREISRSSNG